MQPDLRQMNIDRFTKLLEDATDPADRARIEWLIAEEQAKPDSAYPSLGLQDPAAPGLDGCR